jgi:predicted RNA-binding protein with PUA-like domain
MSKELQERIQLYREDYLNTPEGQKHLATLEAEIREVQKIFADILERHLAKQDITEDLLRHLLPHNDTQHNRDHGYRTSTWPCITKDIRTWFENSGWKQPEDWPPTAEMMLEALDGIRRGDEELWRAFLQSKYRYGFGAGFLSPILFCLDDQRFVVINSKVVKTYKYCTAQLGDPDEIDAILENYLANVAKVRALQRRLAPLGLRTIQEFDIFCHFMVHKRLGGGDLTVTREPEYVAWLFVANPAIFKWPQAFADRGVEWTGSLGSYAQKLLQRQIEAGDRVFGYQAGPDFELQCELRIASAPHQTAAGTWAVNLSPVRTFEQPLSLSTLKADPVLSGLKFVQQTQMSITGITQEQLAALERRLTGTAPPPVLPLVPMNTIDTLCQALQAAQYDTTHPDLFEKRLADAFAALGFETEHQGGAGKTDVLVSAQLGNESYTAIIEAKTRPQGATLSDVDYDSIREHRERNTADYALLIAPAFAGGRLVERAIKYNIGMVTTSALIAILKHHGHFPFSLTELRTLFETKGPADAIADQLGRVHTRHAEYLELTNQVLQIFDDLQRKQDDSNPIPGLAIHLILRQNAREHALAAPSLDQIEDILAFLSNPVLDILTAETNGYVLTLSIDAARRRLLALADLFTSQD